MMPMVRTGRRLPELEARQLFDRLITPIRAVARQHGYAVAVHGSLARDIDLIAVPWRPDVSIPADVAEAVRATAEEITGHLAFIRNDPDADPRDFTKRNPEPKFHGRLGWSIYVTSTGRGGYSTYIDLSVMPSYANAVERYHEEIERMATSHGSGSTDDASDQRARSAEVDSTDGASPTDAATY
jgi:hypothetical protein